REVPVGSVRSMEQIVRGSVEGTWMETMALSAFAGLALLLAGIGTYGLISFTVTERRQEIGIRVALGAQSRDIVHMVARQGLVLSLVGLVSGASCALALTRAMRSLLYEARPNDPAVSLAACGLLATSALLASSVPARRALRADPIRAMRCE